MLRAPVLLRRLPGDSKESLPRPARDSDVSLLQEWLQRNDVAAADSADMPGCVMVYPPGNRRVPDTRRRNHSHCR